MTLLKIETKRHIRRGKGHFCWKLILTNTKPNHHVSSTDKHQNQRPCLIATWVSKSFCFPWGHGVAGPASHTGAWESSSLPVWKWNRSPGWLGRKEKGPRSPALWQTPSCPWVSQERDQVPMGLPAAPGSSGLEQIRQHQKRVCQPELCMVSPKPTRVVEQPTLMKALVTGAGTAEKDHSKQKAHQDDTG